MLQLAAEKCCCETNLNIERQGNETRALIRDQFAQSQAVLICDLKSQIQTRDFQLSQLSQTAQLACKINQVDQLINFSCLLRKLRLLAAAVNIKRPQGALLRVRYALKTVPCH